jgi:hypothetical protein
MSFNLAADDARAVAVRRLAVGARWAGRHPDGCGWGTDSSITVPAAGVDWLIGPP